MAPPQPHPEKDQEPVRRVALYARVSTKGQDVGTQLARLREWVAGQKGMVVEMERIDVASGRLVRRPGQEQIMQEARGHHVHAVAVAKVDRWARSIKHLASTVEELHALGVDFYAVDQGLNVKKADPTSQLILNVLGAVAQWEASIISERTKDGLVGKLGRGRHVKGCGTLLPCPSGRHGPKKGIQPPSEENAAAERGGDLDLNGRLIPRSD